MISPAKIFCAKLSFDRIFQIGDISQSEFHQLHKKYFSFFFN